MGSLPDGVRFADGKLTFKITKKSLVGGHTLELKGLVKDAPLKVKHSITFPLNVTLPVVNKEKNSGSTVTFGADFADQLKQRADKKAKEEAAIDANLELMKSRKATPSKISRNGIIGLTLHDKIKPIADFKAKVGVSLAVVEEAE